MGETICDYDKNGQARRKGRKTTNMKLEQQLSKARDFLSRITPEDNVGIIYHKDTDGVCSAALIIKGVKKLAEGRGLVINVSAAIPSTYDVLDSSFRELKDCDKIVKGRIYS